MPKSVPTPRAVSSFTAREIASLLKQSRTIFTTPLFSLKATSREGTFSKILVVTPKKMGTAPQRNLIKRRLKALFYEEKFYQGPFTLVIYCRKGSDHLPYQELKALIGGVLSKTFEKPSSSLLSS